MNEFQPITLADIQEELDASKELFPQWPSDALHALSVLGEEYGELTKEVLQTTYEPHKSTPQDLRKEAIQCAAMALRFAYNLNRYTFTPREQHKDHSPITYNTKELTEFISEHHPYFKESIYDKCAYTAAAYMLAFSELYPELRTRLAVVTGCRYDSDIEEYVDSLIHSVVEVKGKEGWVQVETTDAPIWDNNILDRWADDYIKDRENIDAYIDEYKTFTDDWEGYWELCGDRGSPEDKDLVESLKQQIIESFKKEDDLD